jgi:hypothetical protein
MVPIDLSVGRVVVYIYEEAASPPMMVKHPKQKTNLSFQAILSSSWFSSTL